MFESTIQVNLTQLKIPVYILVETAPDMVTISFGRRGPLENSDSEGWSSSQHFLSKSGLIQSGRIKVKQFLGL